MLPIVALKREGAPPNPNHPLKGQNLAPFQSLQADEALTHWNPVQRLFAPSARCLRPSLRSDAEQVMGSARPRICLQAPSLSLG